MGVVLQDIGRLRTVRYTAAGGNTKLTVHLLAVAAHTHMYKYIYTHQHMHTQPKTHTHTIFRKQMHQFTRQNFKLNVSQWYKNFDISLH